MFTCHGSEENKGKVTLVGSSGNGRCSSVPKRLDGRDLRDNGTVPGRHHDSARVPELPAPVKYVPSQGQLMSAKLDAYRKVPRKRQSAPLYQALGETWWGSADGILLLRSIKFGTQIFFFCSRAFNILQHNDITQAQLEEQHDWVMN